MTYNQATLHAATGKVLMLPGWHGYFYWNYASKELNFRDGDYHLDGRQHLKTNSFAIFPY